MCTLNEKFPENLEEIMETIKEFTLLDDAFMSVVFNDNTELTEYVLRVILDRNDLTVTSVKSQYNYGNSFGHGVRLDVMAVDTYGNRYDIEVQRAKDPDLFKRARYYQALMDSKSLGSGEKFKNLSNSYIIFILDYDLLGKGLPIYHVESRFREIDEPYDDGSNVIFVNGTYRDTSNTIGSLMHDFSCSDYRSMDSEVISNTIRDFKSPGSKEAKKLSELVERIFRDRFEQLKAEHDAEMEKERQARLNAVQMLQETEQSLKKKEEEIEKLRKVLAEHGIDCENMILHDSDSSEYVDK